jgi:hypothetical protein
MPIDDTTPTYVTKKQDGQYTVCAPSGRVMMTLSDPASAAHYVTLLKEAYGVGYKQGYRDARKS